ncbi:hypothetical protein D8674_010920 [Pyrus ussuriensis x Pyrus communis]|uniref:Uncharacterized protein n=1 Tax=Pyrus ussuriensis x Pyrus communis TaxID=2448454 RepID=A0A5N5G2X4_9ROSA|nr:hypothetical protein D8674_010920 [Pyrus ussuriensis x Pyrus communis]
MGDRDYHEITMLESSEEEEWSEEEEANVAAMRKKLPEQRREETTGSRSSLCIDRVPPSLTGICPEAIEPEIVSIGPHHHNKGKLLEFESYKWWFLKELLFRKRNERGRDLLGEYYEAMENLEERTKSCYSEEISKSITDFVEMMVLDGCFIIELFLQMSTAYGDRHTILTRPWLELVPIVTRDLLKLQNQLPFFVLKKLFKILDLGTKHSLAFFALEFFNHSLPRPSKVLKLASAVMEEDLMGAKHLLHLFHLSFSPDYYTQQTLQVPCQVALLPAKLFIYFSRFLRFSRIPYDNDRDSNHNYRPSSESIQCTAQLRPSGIKFMPRRDAESLLDIDFRNGVLRIPPITINDLAIVVFINCMAFERCHQYIPQGHRSQHFTAYIAFMSCLINSTRDVRLLCADGIITGFSLNDQYVAEMFTKLGDKVEFNIRNCYLSEQFRDVEAYYSSHWAAFMRTYFSRPWSFISVFTAFILLLLTGVQTVMSILSHLQAQRSKD